MEVVDDEPLGRRIEQVDEREAERPPTRCRGACGRAGRRAPRRAHTATAWTTSSSSGLGHSHQSGASSGDDRVEVGAEPRDLLAVEVGHLEEAAVGRRPDGLGQVADVEAPGLEGPLLEDRERATSRPRTPRSRARGACVAGVTRPRRPARAAPASARRARPRSPAPRTSPCPRRRSRRASAASAASRRTAAASASGSPGGHEQRVVAVRQQLAGSGRVGRDERRRRRRAPGRPCSGSRAPPSRPSRRRRARSRPPGSRPGRSSYSTHGTHSTFGGARRRAAARAGRCPTTPERDLGQRARAAARIVSSPCRGISLPTKRTWNGRSGCQPGPEEPVLGADEADLDPVGARGRTPRGRTRRAPRCRRRRGRRAGTRAGRARARRRRRASRARNAPAVVDERVVRARRAG